MATIYDERTHRDRFHALCRRYGHHRTLAVYNMVMSVYWARRAAVDPENVMVAEFREWSQLDRENAARERNNSRIFEREIAVA